MEKFKWKEVHFKGHQPRLRTAQSYDKELRYSNWTGCYIKQKTRIRTKYELSAQQTCTDMNAS